MASAIQTAPARKRRRKWKGAKPEFFFVFLFFLGFESLDEMSKRGGKRREDGQEVQGLSLSLPFSLSLPLSVGSAFRILTDLVDGLADSVLQLVVIARLWRRRCRSRSSGGPAAAAVCRAQRRPLILGRVGGGSQGGRRRRRRTSAIC